MVRNPYTSHWLSNQWPYKSFNCEIAHKRKEQLARTKRTSCLSKTEDGRRHQKWYKKPSSQCLCWPQTMHLTFPGLSRVQHDWLTTKSNLAPAMGCTHLGVHVCIINRAIIKTVCDRKKKSRLIAVSSLIPPWFHPHTPCNHTMG